MMPRSGNGEQPESDWGWPHLRQRTVGCGCMLPGSGLLLVGLAVALFILVAKKEGLGPSPWWALVFLLLAGAVLLFGQVRIRR